MPNSKKQRKPYPTYDERIAAIETKTESVAKLIASREVLVAETKKKLDERIAALKHSKDELTALQEKKARIIENKAKAENKVNRPKLTPEERAEHRKESLAKARAARKVEKEKRDALMAKLAESGKTIDDILNMLEN